MESSKLPSFLRGDDKGIGKNDNRGQKTNKDAMSISEIFNCYICFGKVRNAVMCPQCSKLCCEQCIKVIMS